MNFRAIAIFVFLAVVSASLMVHFRQQSITRDPEETPNLTGIPEPPKSGPFGKFVVDGSTDFDFGVMEFGQKGSHEFKIRNAGSGPLKMVARKEDHTCQCTLGSLGTDGLKPGEETTVTMSWEIKNPASQFQHSAKIRTDDPDNPVTTFLVKGLVGRRLAIAFGNEVHIGLLSEKTPTTREIVVFSETADAFEITQMVASTPLIEPTPRALNGEELQIASTDQNAKNTERMVSEAQKAEATSAAIEKAKGNGITKEEAVLPEIPGEESSAKRPPVKSGYEVKVVFQPGFPIGKFREFVTIHTNLPDTPPITVMFDGSRAGPVQILGTPGISWTQDDAVLRLGRFRAEIGKKAKLIVFVKKTENPWEITDVKVSPASMKHQFIKDENFKGAGRDRYDLLLEVPPGEPPLTFSGDNAGSLILTTTHPEAKLIKLTVEFTSF